MRLPGPQGHPRHRLRTGDRHPAVDGPPPGPGLSPAADYHQPLDETEATLLLSVIWCGRSPEYATFRAQHLDLERELRLRGLIRDKGVPTKAEASADVQYSLRLTHGDHLADPDDPFAAPPCWRRPHLQEPWYTEADGSLWPNDTDDTGSH